MGPSVRAIIFAIAIAFLLGTPALAGHRHGGPNGVPGTCPSNAGGIADGCATNPLLGTGNFRNPAWFTGSTTPSVTGGMIQSPSTQTLAVTPLTAVASHNIAGVSLGYNLGLPSKIFVASISGMNGAVISGTGPAAGDTLDEGCGNDTTSCGILQGTHVLTVTGSNFTLDKNEGALGVGTYYAQSLVSPDSLPNGANCVGCTYNKIGTTGNIVSTVAEVDMVGSPTATLVDWSASNRCSDRTGNPTTTGSGITGCIDGRATLIKWGGATTAVTLSYNKLVQDSFINAGTGALAGNTAYQVRANGGTQTVITLGGLYDSCGTFDAYCPAGFNNYLTQTGFPSFVVNSSSKGSWLNTYGVWLGVDGRFIDRGHNSASGDFYETDYSYICGMAYSSGAVFALPHGEFEVAGLDTGTFGFKMLGDTLCQPANVGTDKDGVQIGANIYAGQSFIDGWAVGALSPLKGAASQIVQNGPGTTALQASTTLSFYGTGTTGVSCTTGSTPALATCLGISKAATGSATSSPVLVYGGTGSNNATTSLIAPWGTNPLSVITSATFDDNTFIVNQAPLFGGSASNCTIPGSALGPCFVTTGTAFIALEFNQYTGTFDVSGNYGFAPGGFFWYADPTTTLTGASIASGVLTSNCVPGTGVGQCNLQVGFWVIDSANSTLGGVAAVQINSAPSGTGPYTYTLTGSAPNLSAETMYVRQAIITVSRPNINMMDGSICNPNPIATNDSGCTGVHQ